MRSKLFVPGIRPELFEKAMASAADALSFDLEDAVPADRKHEARDQVANFLAGVPRASRNKQIIIRVNGPDSAEWTADVRACMALEPDLINLPKVESAEQLLSAIRQLEAIEADAPARRRAGLLVNIETPRALRNAAGIASAHARVHGLQLGLGDLFEPHGIARQDLRNVHAAQHAMRMATAEAGVFAYDAAFPRLHDEAGFRAEAGSARALGYLGKSCVHPGQVSWANEVFQPTDEEIEAARRVVTAADEAGRRGHGAFAANGQMIDAPFLARARAVLANARTVTEEDGE